MNGSWGGNYRREGMIPYRENALVRYETIPSAKSKKNLLRLAKIKEKKNKILAKENAKKLDIEIDVLARSDKWVKFWMENVDEQLNQAILSGRKFGIEISEEDIHVFQRILEHGGYTVNGSHSKSKYSGEYLYLFEISVPQDRRRPSDLTICVISAIVVGWVWLSITHFFY